MATLKATFHVVSRLTFVLLSLATVSTIIALFVLPRSAPETGVGCYLADRLFLYVSCEGFVGSSVLDSALNLPWQLLFMAGYFLTIPKSPQWSIHALTLTAVAWAVLALAIIGFRDLRRDFQRRI